MVADRPLRVAVGSRRLLQTGSAQFLEAEVEAERSCFLLDDGGASFGLCLVCDAALLAGSSRFVQKHSLGLHMPLLHHLSQAYWKIKVLFSHIIQHKNVIKRYSVVHSSPTTHSCTRHLEPDVYWLLLAVVSPQCCETTAFSCCSYTSSGLNLPQTHKKPRVLVWYQEVELVANVRDSSPGFISQTPG